MVVSNTFHLSIFELKVVSHHILKGLRELLCRHLGLIVAGAPYLYAVIHAYEAHLLVGDAGPFQILTRYEEASVAVKGNADEIAYELPENLLVTVCSSG